MIKYYFFLLTIFLNTPVRSQEALDSVPFHFVHNLIFLDVFVNDFEEPLHFLFDTGAGISVIDVATSQNIQLKTTDQASIATAGKSITAKLSSENKIKIGKKLVLNDITFAAMDLSHISKYLKTKLSGIIGSDLLQNLITEINVDAKTFRFYSPTSFTYRGNGTVYDLITLEAGHIGLPIEIVTKRNSKPLPLIVKIDSGAEKFLTLHNEAIKKFSLLNSIKRQKVKKGFGVDSTITTNISGKIFSAKFCEKEWENIPVVFEVDSLNTSSKRKADGLIGQKMLLDFNITYNLKGGLVYLEKRK